MLIKTQNGSYCNTKHVVAYEIQNGIGHDAFNVIAVTVNSGKYPLAQYKTKEMAENAIDAIITKIKDIESETVYDMASEIEEKAEVSETRDYPIIGFIPAENLASYPVNPDTTAHTVYDAGLTHGAELHRFENHAHVPYSAIYYQGSEMFSCAREYEQKMFDKWNNSSEI